jgi:hypothetical protein
LDDSPDIVRVIKSRKTRWAGNSAFMRKMRNAYKIFRKPRGKKPLARRRHRWEDNIRRSLKYGGKVWTGCIWLKIRHQWLGLVNRAFLDYVSEC